MATAQRPPVFSPPQGPLPNFTLSPLPNFELNDTTLFAVYCFIKNFVGVTSCASSVIDHKIEQAMDLVKTHLMSSMRAEVESLKARIAELMERIHQLEMENDFLKANASPEVLIALNNGAARIQESTLSFDFVTPTN